MSSQHDHTFNLTAWVQRLGFKRSEDPELNYDVQPVLDVKGLTPRVQGPGALVGGNSGGAAAGTHSFMSWHSRSPGGMILHEVFATLIGSGVFGIVDGAHSATETEIDFDNEVTQPTPAVVGLGGSVLAANRLLVPILEYPYVTAFPLNLRTEVYIPNGRRFLIESVGAAVAISGYAVVEEFPAPRG